MLFLLQGWDKVRTASLASLLIHQKMNYQVEDTMEEVDAKDKTFTEFFAKVKMSVIVLHLSFPFSSPPRYHLNL